MASFDISSNLLCALLHSASASSISLSFFTAIPVFSSSALVSITFLTCSISASKIASADFFFIIVCCAILWNSSSQSLTICWRFNSSFSFCSINCFSFSYFVYTADAPLYSSCSSSIHFSLVSIFYRLEEFVLFSREFFLRTSPYLQGVFFHYIWISNVLLVATIAKVPNISQFIQSSCLQESIRKPLASLKSATSSIGFDDLIN